MIKTKRVYRYEMEKAFDLLELCSNERVNRSMISRMINLGSNQVIEFTTMLVGLNYLETTDSGSQYNNGKMLYYKTTPAGNEFKRIISDWVKVRKKQKK